MSMKSKQEQFIDTAMKLFLEKGYDAVSVQDICDTLHVTKPTFYRYVGAKEQVLVYQFDKVQAQVLEKARKLAGEGEYVKALVQALTISHEAASKMGFELFRVYIKSLLVDGGSSWRYSRELCRLMTDIISHLQQQERITNEADPLDLYYLLVHLDQGVSIEWCTRKGNFDMTRFYCRVAGTVLGLKELAEVECENPLLAHPCCRTTPSACSESAEDGILSA